MATESAVNLCSERRYTLDQAGSIESRRQGLDQCAKKSCMSDDHLIYMKIVSSESRSTTHVRYYHQYHPYHHRSAQELDFLIPHSCSLLLC